MRKRLPTLWATAKTGTQVPDVFEALCAEVSRKVQEESPPTGLRSVQAATVHRALTASGVHKLLQRTEHFQHQVWRPHRRTQRSAWRPS